MKTRKLLPILIVLTLTSCGISYDLSSLSHSTLSSEITSQSSLEESLLDSSITSTTSESSLSSSSQSESSSQEDLYVKYPLSSLTGTNLINENYAYWVGRTTYDATKLANMMYYTGTGFKVRIFGTQLTVGFYLQKTSPGTPDDNYVQVLVDEQIAPMEGQVKVVTSVNKTISITGLTPGYHVISLLRRNEPIEGNIGITSLTTDGQICQAPTFSGLKFSIVGASGISGNGAIGLPSEDKTTENSSSLHSFGFLTARMFDAESQFVSASGWGVVYGYNDANSTGNGENIVKAFDKVGINDTDQLVNETFDISSYVPDYVVVNAGGNDFTAYINNQSGATKTAAIDKFKLGVSDFLTYLHTNYPQVKILWTATNTSTGNGAASSSVISDLDPSGNYVRMVIIPGAGDDGDPMGANAHASVVTHIRTAEILATTIESWSGITRVRNNIVYS